MTYQFTTDWFLGNVRGSGTEFDFPGIWNKLLQGRPVSKILEIGSYEGRSAIFLAEKFPAAEIYCIDTWRGSPEHRGVQFDEIEQRFDANTANLNVRKLKMESRDGCAKLIADGHSGSFDLAYIDGSHKAADVLADGKAAFTLCKPGALIIFDDYGWRYGVQHGGTEADCPKQGIDIFVAAYAVRVLPETDYQLYCEKQ